MYDSKACRLQGLILVQIYIYMNIVLKSRKLILNANIFSACYLQSIDLARWQELNTLD